MATEKRTKGQSKAEIRIWPGDFKPDLLEGVTIAGASAIHIDPNGTEAPVPAVFDSVSGIVCAQIGPLAALGDHYLRIFADCDNGEKLEIRLTVPVEW